MAQTQVPPLSFPYPVNMTTARPSGQGCNYCIHRAYCPAYYWHIRWQERTVSDDYGRACASWSNKEEDRIRTKAEGDFYLQEQMELQRIAAEKNQNGCDEL